MKYRGENNNQMMKDLGRNQVRNQARTQVV